VEFQPDGIDHSDIQIEDHEVNLYGVWMLHLIVRPEIARPSRRHHSKLASCIGRVYPALGGQAKLRRRISTYKIERSNIILPV
jgi:hypothetical protein